MVRIENHLGLIEVESTYFAGMVGHAVSECFGVAGLVNSSTAQGIRSLIARKDVLDKGVRVRSVKGQLIIDLHIAVSYGVNISAIVGSIVHKVSYVVENACGMQVSKVNIFVADIVQ